MKTYIEIFFHIEPFNEDYADIIIAELTDLDYDNFVKDENGIYAYILSEDYDANRIDEIYFLKNQPNIKRTIKEIKEQNWNQKWEENYPYIELEKCIVYAPFHENIPKKEYEIKISPKMSFGTGHHATTYMMLDFMLNENLTNSDVLDMGCGTGVLAILAAKKGSQKVTAIDIDEWAFENSLENIKLNKTEHIQVLKGDKSLLGSDTYDFIFANINRNILIEDIPSYEKVLNSNGKLFLSGFYESDVKDIRQLCEKHNLSFQEIKERNSWCALSFTKL